jgi:hypothetical protein
MFDSKARVLRDPLYQGAQVLGAGELDRLVASAAEQMMSVDELRANIPDAAVFQVHPPEIAELGQKGDRSVYRHQPERAPVAASEGE